MSEEQALKQLLVKLHRLGSCARLRPKATSSDSGSGLSVNGRRKSIRTCYRSVGPNLGADPEPDRPGGDQKLRLNRRRRCPPRIFRVNPRASRRLGRCDEHASIDPRSSSDHRAWLFLVASCWSSGTPGRLSAIRTTIESSQIPLTRVLRHDRRRPHRPL
jgi:hypothetical protein